MLYVMHRKKKSFKVHFLAQKAISIILFEIKKKETKEKLLKNYNGYMDTTFTFTSKRQVR